MIKFLLTLTLFVASITVSGQQILDVSRNAECELFPQKKEYDQAKRIEEIEKLEGQLVTVFIVRRKTSKIKLQYRGTMKNAHVKGSSLSEKAKAKVACVEVVGNGIKSMYFPLTDDRRYRIYLTECLSRK